MERHRAASKGVEAAVAEPRGMDKTEQIERTLAQEVRPALPEGSATGELYLYPGAQPVAGFVLTRRLGTGSYGEVWEAMSPNDAPIALKFVNLDKDARLREQRGLTMPMGVKHVRLLEVLESWHRGDYFIIALPVAEG